MAVDMTPIATVERDAKLEGKNMFMILAPRPVPTGPPKFTQPHHDAAATAAASAAIDEKAERELAAEEHHEDTEHHENHEVIEEVAAEQQPADAPQGVVSSA
jgi:hypothetical protein